MKLSTMRRVDFWAGIPLCWLLTLFRRFAERFRPAPKPARRILFIKLAEQGGTVQAYSTLRRAAEMVGENNVYFLCFEKNKHILKVLDSVPTDNIITIPTSGFLRFLAGTLLAVFKMRLARPDIAIDMEFFARFTALLTYLSGARKRVGFHAFSGEASYRGDLMTHRLNFNPHLHVSRLYRIMLEASSLPADTLPALACELPPDFEQPEAFEPDPSTLREVRATLKEEGGWHEDKRLILLNANCSDMLPIRRWPGCYYVTLARKILGKYPEALIAFTGPPDDRQAVRELIGEIGSDRCFSLAGRTTFLQLLTLYTLSDLIVTSDCGPAHFSALAHLPTVTMFGPETPAVFGSRAPGHHALTAGLACSPCLNAYNDRRSPCPDNVCMRYISVEAVFAKVAALLRPF